MFTGVPERSWGAEGSCTQKHGTISWSSRSDRHAALTGFWAMYIWVSRVDLPSPLPLRETRQDRAEPRPRGGSSFQRCARFGTRRTLKQNAGSAAAVAGTKETCEKERGSYSIV